jgi:hypothetical protein
VIRNTIIKNLSNIPGWHTDRKFVVFESDDWGSIRMPSNETRNLLIEKSVIPNNNISHYYLYDALESNDDLSLLFEILQSFRDGNGNHPVFTGVNVVANPDFDRIRDCNFEKYYYEPFTRTLARYPKHDKVLNLWKEGVERKLFVPQFHGREHLNVTAWMNALLKGKPKTRIAFNNYLSGIDPVVIGESNLQYQAAYHINEATEINYLKQVLNEGILLFNRLLGYKPTFFVPPNGYFNLSLLETLQELGIKYIMLSKIQREPLGSNKYKTHIRWLGKKNRFGQIALSRNASFEPSSGRKDWVDGCMHDIELAFKWKKPATISTHRVNYIGYLNPDNRGRNLRLLKSLISKLLKKWPDVEFMTSPELGALIEKHK